VNYQAPSAAAGFGRLVARAMLALARRPALWRDEPRRSSWTPATMGALLARHGVTVTADEDTLTLARRLPMEVRQRRSLENGRVATAVLAQ
jgi:hypothetical protein